MDEFSHFQFFIDLYWPWVLGFLAVRIICGYYGDVMYWISKAFGFGSE